MPTGATASTTGSFLIGYGDDAVSNQTVQVNFDPSADGMRQNIETALNALFGTGSVKAFLLEHEAKRRRYGEQDPSLLLEYRPVCWREA